MSDRAKQRLQRLALTVKPLASDVSIAEAPLEQIESFEPLELETVGEDAEKSSRGVVSTLGEYLARPWIYYLFHSYRLFGWAWLVPPAMYLKPLHTMGAIATYAAIHRQRWWQRSVHRFLGYGASRRHKIVNENGHLIKPDKRYLFSIHPHSVLADGWHSIIARNLDSFETGVPTLNRKIHLCFAPIIQHVPVHQEMYRECCGDADKKSIMNVWKTDADPALIPGGFAESVFANASDTKHEYSYIKDRKGFVRIAIEAGTDIVPLYTFRSSRMYYNPGYMRGWRARFSQQYYIGLVPFMGWMGTSMPLTDKTTTVVMPPFESSKYTLEQLDEAHAAYMEHLKYHFDENKALYGMRDVELVFVGNDWEDDDVLSRFCTKLGLIKPHKAKPTASL